MNTGKPRNFTRRKSCFITKNNIAYIDYKDIELLSKFMGSNNKILPARTTGTNPKYQRLIAKNIKRAQIIGLLRYSR
ncbi:30S ribosomal protein S18 [Spiroplasma ixodetis]|uniref:30S ribosomal protein S18 n=1 Tax=Spiroplasma ixodetis TaxID=2141 RepID=UPI0025761CC1|nr:30S ribosomal protein S18 [Spiroplasma ixodetis]WJG69372.1 30S ribosomal protein S18 [Spiroplasma ixodetis Y32]